MEDFRLNINRVRQSSFKYCGPACIEMVSNYYGITTNQDSIWEGTRQHMLEPKKFYTDPEALADYLIEEAKIPVTFTVDDLSYESFFQCIAKITRSVVYYSMPPCILISQGRHWVVVEGVKATFDDPSKESGVVAGLYISDPSRGHSGIIYKPLNESFKNDYLNPVKPVGALSGTQWANKIVTVCEGSQDVVNSISIPNLPRPSGGGFGGVTFSEAEELAIGDIAHYGLGVAHKILGGGANPIIKKYEVHLISGGLPYYIIPLDLSGELVWAIFLSSELELESVLLDEQFKLPATGEEARGIVQDNFDSEVDLQEQDGLWWERCSELETRYKVVRRLKINDVEYYLDSENRLLDKLHRIPTENYLAG